uniref:Uncharacterized protein n=1 Tax=Cucumis melo TaxID=3656 RepID=A0A9I9E1V2_CUCME
MAPEVTILTALKSPSAKSFWLGSKICEHLYGQSLRCIQPSLLNL